MSSTEDIISGRGMSRNEATEHPVGLRLTRVHAEKVIRSYHQVVPMMAATVTATAVARHIAGYSIYSARLSAAY
jgi:hypothetical protein